MKIKEIREGFLDGIGIGTKPLPPNASMRQRVTLKRSLGDIKRVADVATKAWAGRVNRMEKQQAGPLSDKQYQEQLRQFVDQLLMGDVSLTALEKDSPEGKKMIDKAMAEISSPQGRNDMGVWQDRFKTISAVATSWVDSGQGMDKEQTPAQAQQPDPDEDPNPFKLSGRTARAGNLELNLDDPTHKKLYNMIRAEWRAGDKNIAK